jgi:spoIIIJ-associated protein
MKEKMDYLEKWGKDVDEAVKLALMDLKLTEDEVKVTVLEEPTKGFLGLGAKLAKVRVEKKTANEAEGGRERGARREKDLHKNEKKGDERAERSFIREEKFSVSEKAKDLVPVTDGNAAEAFVRKLMEKMGLDVNTHAFENSEYIYIEIDGKDSRIVIG